MRWSRSAAAPTSGRLPHTLCRPCGDRVLAGGHDPEQGVERRRASGDLSGAGHHETARAVVEEGGIRGPQLCPEDGVVLVAGAGDGMEAAVRLLQLTSGAIDLAARDLVLEQLDGSAGCEDGPGMQGIVQAESGCGGRQAGEQRIQRILDDGDPIEGHAEATSGRWVAAMIAAPSAEAARGRRRCLLKPASRRRSWPRSGSTSVCSSPARRSPNREWLLPGPAPDR